MRFDIKKTAIVLLFIVGCIVVAIARPWNTINLMPFITPTTALTVNSLKGKSEVFLDGKKVGETPYSSEQLRPGDYELEIRRISENDSFYEPITKTIHLELGTRTFVEAELGPSLEFSSYKIVYYRKNISSKASLYILSSPAGGNVHIDSKEVGDTPLTQSEITEGRHTVAVSRKGYETEEITVIARSSYTLIVELHLMTQPIDLTQQ